MRRRRLPRSLTWKQITRPAEPRPVHPLDRLRFVRALPSLEGGTEVIEVETAMGTPAFVARGKHGWLPRVFHSVEALRAALEGAR